MTLLIYTFNHAEVLSLALVVIILPLCALAMWILGKRYQVFEFEVPYRRKVAVSDGAESSGEAEESAGAVPEEAITPPVEEPAAEGKDHVA